MDFLIIASQLNGFGTQIPQMNDFREFFEVHSCHLRFRDIRVRTAAIGKDMV